MRIAFDLDDTLLSSQHRFAQLERRGLLARILGRERLRRGAVGLLRTLRRGGHEVWVYTNSYRSELGIRLLFAGHAIRLGGVITQRDHERVVLAPGSAYPRCSKYPPAFGIDVLVDNSPGIALEARRHGFRMIEVAPEDPAWDRAVLSALGEAAASA